MTVCKFKNETEGCSLLPTTEETRKRFFLLDKTANDYYACNSNNHQHLIDMTAIQRVGKESLQKGDEIALRVLEILEAGCAENFKSGSQDFLIDPTKDALTRAIELTDKK